MSTNKVDIVAFAAHPDDVELACSGTLLVQKQLGKKIAIVDLTQGELGTRGSKEIRAEESANSAKYLGLEERINLKMADGFFTHSQENLIKIIETLRYFQPEIVLANSFVDRHPDHGRASKLVSEACFLAGLSKIETSFRDENQNPYRPNAVYHYIQDYLDKPDFIVDISGVFDQKMEAIKCFKSQFYDPNSEEPASPISGKEFFDFLKGRAMEYGRLIKAEYGEGFQVERPVGVTDLSQLK